MRPMTIPTYLVPLFFGTFFLISITSTQPLHAQTQAPASVPVRMIQAIDSSKDAAGKQYRAAVTKAVDAGNDLMIPQGATASVTLVSSGSGWTTHLVSVSVNGHAVALTSGPATVTSAGPSAASSAVNAVSSMLGSFGHHVKAPTGIADVAMGQRVVLSPGDTLTFLLTQPPPTNVAASTSPAAPAAPALTTSAAPAPSPAASPAPAAANGRSVYCFTSKPSDGQTVAYFSDVFPEPHIGLHVTVDWNVFLQKKSLPQGSCINVLHGQKQLREDQYRREKKQIVETGWKYTPDATTHAAEVTAPAAAINDYYVYCIGAANTKAPVGYVSDIFMYNERISNDSRDTSAELAGPFLQFLIKKYGIKVNPDFYSADWNGPNYPAHCSISFASLQEAQRDKQTVGKRLHIQIVETGWKTTIVPSPAEAAPPAAANEYYVSCYSNSDHGLSSAYFSEIFASAPTADPIRNAFLAFLQKKYGFNDTRPGPVDCEVSPKPGDAYMFKTEWTIRQNREGLAKIRKKKVVETGWKYTP